MSTPRVENIDRRIARTRAAVLDAATSQLLQHGIAAVTIDGLTATSGVAKTTIYRHWATRAEVIWDALDALIPAPTEPELSDPTDETLLTFVVATARDLIDAPWASVIPALLDAAEREPELAAFRSRLAERFLRPLRQLLAKGIERQELPVDLNIEEAVSHLVGPMMYRRFVTHDPLGEKYCAVLVEDFLHKYGG